MNGFIQAISLLSIIPTGRWNREGRYDPACAAPWFPTVGLLFGLLLVGAHRLLMCFFPPVVSAVALVGSWALLSGGLHLDGLCDSGDGLLAAASRERRLEIMKDPRVGSFGAITLILYLMLQTATIAALPEKASYGLLLAPIMGRWLILLATTQPQARAGGMGASMAGIIRGRSLATAAIVPLAACVCGGVRSVIAVIVAHAVAALVFHVSRKRLGGVTGDIYGLTVQTTELSVLLVYVARLA